MVCISSIEMSLTAGDRRQLIEIGPGKVNVVYGAHDLDVRLGGFTAEEIQYSLRDVLNVGMEAEAYLDGILIADKTITVFAGHRLEFMRTFGWKAAIDLENERVLSLAQAARRLPHVRGEKTPHPSTLYRWATEGRKSRSGRIVRLEIVRVGGTDCRQYRGPREVLHTA